MKMRNIVAGALLVGSLILPSATAFAKGEREPGDDHGRHRGGQTTVTVRRGQAEPGDDRGGRRGSRRSTRTTQTAQRGQVERGDDHGKHGAGHR